MPGTSATKAKSRVLSVPDAIITINGGQPSPADVYIKPNGTVQFVNKDDVNWRVRLFTREHGEHADVDLFLPVRSSVTVIAPETGECRYEVLEAGPVATGGADAANTGKKNGGGSIAAGSGATASANTSKAAGGSGGGGGTIRIGPTPS
ncbi:MAG: hypothetical protein JO119_05005 [Acidobacteria bacterium]|nr:hypothetical protein [Acidobacteriota bacterium]